MKRRRLPSPVWLAAACLAVSQAANAHSSAYDTSPPSTPRNDSAPMSHADTAFGLRTLVGVSTSPFFVPSLPTAKGHAIALLANGRVRLDQGLALAAHVPVVLGSVAQPAGALVDASAVGNPVLELLWESSVARVLDTTPTLSLGFGVGAPLASHDDGLLSNRVLAIADGLEGHGHSEWFTPGVLPLMPSVRLSALWTGWHVAAGLRLPTLLRVSDASMGDADARGLALAAVVDVNASTRLSESLSVEAAIQMVIDVVAPVSHVRPVSPLQDLERLSLYAKLSSSMKVGFELQTATSGAIGGSMVAAGVALAATF